MKVLHAQIQHEGLAYDVTRSTPTGIAVRRADGTLAAWISAVDPGYTVARQRERVERETATLALMEAVLDAIGVGS